jgi:hypothetical protein
MLRPNPSPEGGRCKTKMDLQERRTSQLREILMLVIQNEDLGHFDHCFVADGFKF